MIEDKPYLPVGAVDFQVSVRPQACLQFFIIVKAAITGSSSFTEVIEPFVFC